ncbi:MAG TPA: hypothetical protein VFQ75_02000 [Candidatus Limnocylindrales bacterium]|jgi:hypothetical protein|nr:hypothetical protein [Candidatus Limnocylindrales bacterium]
MPSFIVALFLVAHGLVHASFARTPSDVTAGTSQWPFDLSRSWVLSPLGLGSRGCRAIGLGLLAVVIVGYVAAAVGALGIASALFVPGVVAGSIASIAMLVLFFHRWLVLGLAIDAALLWAVLANGWRP